MTTATIKRILALLAVAMFSPQLFAANSIFNVKDYGASGNMKDYATGSIQKAIDDCNKAGGGTVLLPPGDYLSATIYLKSNVTFCLTAGATLYASNREADYTDFFGIKGDEQVPMLICARKADNITICGDGTISGQPVYDSIPFKYNKFIAEDCDAAIEAGVPLWSWRRQKPNLSLAILSECKNVKVEDVTFTRSPFWTLHLNWCDLVSVRGVRIYNELQKSPNADGIDINGCNGVTVSDCQIVAGDDAIVVKSTDGGTSSVRNSENIVVTNCILSSSSCALKLGTESFGDFRNIIFSNCVIKDTNRALGILIRDGGTADNILFSNIVIRCTRMRTGLWGGAEAIYFVVIKRNKESKTGRIRNVTVKDIVADVEGTSRIIAYEGENNIENVKLSNISMNIYSEPTPDKRAKEGLVIKNAANVVIDDVTIKWNGDRQQKWSNSFVFEDIDGFYRRDLRAVNQPEGFDPIVEKNVTPYYPVIK